MKDIMNLIDSSIANNEEIKSSCDNLKKDLQKLQDKIDKYDNMSEVEFIIKQIDSMLTDDVAKIYYAIEESHHYMHLEKFKLL